MLLIDRKMPKSCSECVCNNDDFKCNMTGDEFDYDITWTERMPNCPLKDSNELIKKLEEIDLYKDDMVGKLGVLKSILVVERMFGEKKEVTSHDNSDMDHSCL